MKRALYAAIVLVALGGLTSRQLFAQSLGSYPWGSSPRAVAAQTGAVPDSQGSGTLVRRESVLGHAAFVTYHFAAGGLSAVGVQWDHDLFNEIKGLLDREYTAARCTSTPARCSWSTAETTIQLIGDALLGVTLLAVSPKPAR